MLIYISGALLHIGDAFDDDEQTLFGIVVIKLSVFAHEEIDNGGIHRVVYYKSHDGILRALTTALVFARLDEMRRRFENQHDGNYHLFHVTQEDVYVDEYPIKSHEAFNLQLLRLLAHPSVNEGYAFGSR